jgi:hypothetical protein
MIVLWLVKILFFVAGEKRVSTFYLLCHITCPISFSSFNCSHESTNVRKESVLLRIILSASKDAFTS